jgi:hypothetical protein
MKDLYFNRHFVKMDLLRYDSETGHSQFPGEVILNLDKIDHISKKDGEDIYWVHMGSCRSYMMDEHQYKKLCDKL